MSKRLLLLCAGVAIVVMGGCPFQVIYPQALQTTSQDFEIDGTKIKITVTFSGAVDMNSLVARTNVILVTEKDTNADVTIAPGSVAASIIITSVDDIGDLLTFDSDGFFSLRLLGSGASPIRSSDGETLDGDGNGTAGGNYETGFVILG